MSKKLLMSLHFGKGALAPLVTGGGIASLLPSVSFLTILFVIATAIYGGINGLLSYISDPSEGSEPGQTTDKITVSATEKQTATPADQTANLDTMKNKLTSTSAALLIICGMAAISGYSGCQSPAVKAVEAGVSQAFNSPAGQKTVTDLAAISSQAAATALQVAVSKAAGQKGASITNSVAQGLWTSSNAVEGSEDIAALVAALPGAVTAATNAYTAATNAGASPATATNAIAAVVSTAAGAPPK